MRLFGKLNRAQGQLVVMHPEFEMIPPEAEGAVKKNEIRPIYRLTDQLPQRTMRRIIEYAVKQYSSFIEETLPQEIRERYRLPSRKEAVLRVHFPPTLVAAEVARQRLVFEELLLIQLVLVGRKWLTMETREGFAHKVDNALLHEYLSDLPFTLTNAQQRVVKEIQQDLASGYPMQRLLQGDVGSGKTVVAACVLLEAVANGHQAAIMAPTEILARQHFLNLAAAFTKLDIRCALLTKDLTPKEKKEVLAGIKSGRYQIVIGTHALIQEGVSFDSLSVVVIDEQHKFGVRQRGRLYEKGRCSDVLVMTATPIPRTLAMTVYGDLDVSILDERPKNRQEVGYALNS